MHWWIFLELLEDLPEDTMLERVIRIRGEKIDPKNGNEYNRALRRLQDKYRLETPGLDALFG